MNGTVIGTLIGGMLLFLSSILVPVISKRMNKATDAAASAEKISAGAEKNAGMALRIAEGLEDKLEKTEQRCDKCLDELGTMKRRALKRDLSLDAVHAALVEIVPLLPVDSAATAPLRACIEQIRQVRYSSDEAQP